MAQQVVIDIVAQTEKLTAGVNNVNGQLNNLTGGISKAQQAAVGLASAFVLREGVSFLKKANDEAIDAEKTAKLAAIAFGEGSTALQKITTDADKFSKSLAVDNDDLIKLATTLSVNLPDAAKGSSTELVNLGYDVAALKGIDIETWVNKFSKAMVDGNLSLKEMQTLVPDLSDAVYKQAEALFKAGKAQDAMNLLVTEGAKKYGNAAESQVTGTQRMNKAMGDLYETIGTNVAPIVEKLTTLIANMVDWVIQNKNVVIPLVAVLGTFAAGILILNAGLTAYNAIMSAWKVATTLATTAQTLFNAVLAANPIALVIIAIVAIIAVIVLLVKNWDTVTEVIGKVWDTIKDFVSDAWDRLKNFVQNVIDKFTGFKNTISGIWNNVKEYINTFVSNVINRIGDIPSEMFNVGRNIVMGIWNGLSSLTTWFRNKITDFFGGILPSWVKKALGISSPSKVFAKIGTNINEGLIRGLTANQAQLKQDVQFYFGTLLPEWVKNALQIQSPSKKFEKLGVMTAAGFKRGIEKVIPTMFNDHKVFDMAGNVLTSINNKPQLSTSGGIGPSPINITIQAAPGTDLYALGRTVNNAVNKYSRISNQYGVKQQL